MLPGGAIVLAHGADRQLGAVQRMCFSATASFMTAAFAGAAGIVALTRVNRREEFPLAAIPLAFATQQALEGLLWLTLPTQPHGPAQSPLTTVFLLFAKVMWPVLTPFAAWSIEPDRTRRRLIGLCLAGGIAIAAFFLWSLLANVHTARIDGRHIVYSSEPWLPPFSVVTYLMATCIAPLLSSYPLVRVLGAVVTLGSFVTYFFYWEAFTSVWCFFAAAGSVIIVFHFRRLARFEISPLPGR